MTGSIVVSQPLAISAPNLGEPPDSFIHMRRGPLSLLPDAPDHGLDRLLEALPSRLALLDAQLRVVAVNPAWRRAVMAYASVATEPGDYYPEEMSDRDARVIRDRLIRLAAGEGTDFVYNYAAQSGPPRVVALHAMRFYLDRELIMICVHSWTEADQPLADRRRAMEILRAEEEERRRIARELHDETFQQLAAIQLGLDGLRMARRPEENEGIFGRIEHALHAVQHQVRTLSYVLHPPPLKGHGLDEALAIFADGFRRRSGLVVNFVNEAGHVKRAPEVELCLYRVVQEALANVLRHAQATRVEIRLSRDNSNLVLEISDDGVGIPVAKGCEAVETMGVGLASMRERMEALAGTMVLSRLDPGTKVRVSLPRRRRRDV